MLIKKADKAKSNIEKPIIKKAASDSNAEIKPLEKKLSKEPVKEKEDNIDKYSQDQKPGIDNNRDKKSIKKFIIGLVIVIITVILIFIVLGFGIVRFGWSNSFTDAIAKVIPYPAIIFDYKILPYSQYQEDVKTLETFDKNQETDEITEDDMNDIKKMILLRMVRDEILDKKAKEYGITISDTEIDQEFDSIIDVAAQQGTTKAEMLETLQLDDYGWDENDFKQRALKPQILYLKVGEKVALDDTINAEAKKTTEDVFAKVQKGEQSFEELADKYSEDVSSGSGGDLGFFAKGDFADELDNFSEAAFALDEGESSDIIRTKYGFHIINMIERVAASETAGEQIHIAHILIKSKHIEEWMDELLSAANISVLVSDFTWMEDCNLVLLNSESCDSNSLQDDSQNINTDTVNTNQE